MPICNIYEFDGLRRVIQNTVQDLSSSLSLTAEKIFYVHGLNGSYSHVTNLESRNGICKESSTTFAVARTITLGAMSLTILDTTSQVKAPSMVCLMINLDTEIALCHVFLF